MRENVRELTPLYRVAPAVVKVLRAVSRGFSIHDP
jgi:hypothetical protein